MAYPPESDAQGQTATGLPPRSHGSCRPPSTIMSPATLETSIRRAFKPLFPRLLCLTLIPHVLPAFTRPATKPADSDTVEATDRFGSVLTLRLVRCANNNEGSSYPSTAPTATSGRPENNSEAWNTRLVGTATEAGKASSSDGFAAGASLRGEEASPLGSGTKNGMLPCISSAVIDTPMLCARSQRGCLLKNRQMLPSSHVLASKPRVGLQTASRRPTTRDPRLLCQLARRKRTTQKIQVS